MTDRLTPPATAGERDCPRCGVAEGQLCRDWDERTMECNHRKSLPSESAATAAQEASSSNLRGAMACGALSTLSAGATTLDGLLAECREFKMEHRANTKAYGGFSRLEYMIRALQSAPSSETLTMDEERVEALRTMLTAHPVGHVLTEEEKGMDEIYNNLCDLARRGLSSNTRNANGSGYSAAPSQVSDPARREADGQARNPVGVRSAEEMPLTVVQDELWDLARKHFRALAARSIVQEFLFSDEVAALLFRARLDSYTASATRFTVDEAIACCIGVRDGLEGRGSWDGAQRCVMALRALASRADRTIP